MTRAVAGVLVAVAAVFVASIGGGRAPDTGEAAQQPSAVPSISSPATAEIAVGDCVFCIDVHVYRRYAHQPFRIHPHEADVSLVPIGLGTPFAVGEDVVHQKISCCTGNYGRAVQWYVPALADRLGAGTYLLHVHVRAGFVTSESETVVLGLPADFVAPDPLVVAATPVPSAEPGDLFFAPEDRYPSVRAGLARLVGPDASASPTISIYLPERAGATPVADVDANVSSGPAYHRVHLDDPVAEQLEREYVGRDLALVPGLVFSCGGLYTSTYLDRPATGRVTAVRRIQMGTIGIFVPWPTQPPTDVWPIPFDASRYVVVDPIDVQFRFDEPFDECSGADAKFAGRWDFERAFMERGDTRGAVRRGMTPRDVARRDGYPPRFSDTEELASSPEWIYGHDPSAAIFAGSFFGEPRMRLTFVGGRVASIVYGPTPSPDRGVTVRIGNAPARAQTFPP